MSPTEEKETSYIPSGFVSEGEFLQWLASLTKKPKKNKKEKE